MVGSVSLDGGSVCGRTVDPSHPQLLSPEGTGDMPVGQPPTCPHTEEPVPRRRTLGHLPGRPDGLRGALPRTPVARLTSCARTHVHGGDRRTSGAAAAWGRPVPALERIFRPRGTEHAALRPHQSVPGGVPCADGQRGHSRPVRTRVPGPPSGRSVPREPTRPSACPLAFPPAAPQATSLAPDGRCPAPEASPGASGLAVTAVPVPAQGATPTASPSCF